MRRPAFHPANLVLLLVSLSFTACDSAFLTADSTVEAANEALTAGRVDDAKKGYDEAASFLPESPTLNYLRGLAASATGDHTAAHDLLLRALDTKDKTLQQRVQAALGLAYARSALALERTAAANPDPNTPDMAPGQPGQPSQTGPDKAAPPNALDTWKLAVGFLEDALVLDPNDLESRRTLEVALLRVDPPCSTRDDDLEPNNTREDAKLVEFGEEQTASESDPAKAAEQAGPKDVERFRKQLFSCPDNADWYGLELAAGDRVEISATLPKDSGKLVFTIHTPDGNKHTELAPSGEKLRFVVAENQAGRWAIHTDNVDFDEVSYGLEVVVRPACGKTEDTFEDNDSALTAKTVTPGPVPDLKSCPGDEDWYSLVLAEGESLFLYAQPEEPAKDEDKKQENKDTAKVPGLDVEILDETGTVRATGAPTGLARVSTLLTPGPGRYLIRVRSAATGFGPTLSDPFEGRYSLQFEVVPPCPEGDDRFEDNDMPEDATDFSKASTPENPQGQDPAAMPGQLQQAQQAQQGPPVVFARVCPGESDWWSFTTTGEKPEIISATFDHGQGDLDLILYDESGTTENSRSAMSTAEQNGEAVALPLDEELAKKKAAQKAAQKAGQAGQAGQAPQPLDNDEVLTPTPKTWKLLIRGATAEAQNFYLLRLDQPSGGGGDSQNQDEGEDEQDQEDQKDQDQKDQDQKDGQDPSDKKDPPQPEQPEPSALQDALDKLDKNPENLPARDAANRSPLANQKPLKDW